MRLVVDGLIFQKDPHGGIARLYHEMLPRICDLAPDLRVTLFIDGPVRASLPFHPQIRLLRTPAVKRTLRVQGYWRKAIYPVRRLASRTWNFARKFWLRGEQSAIWHSTYYTLPDGWRGPQVVTIHDMIPEQYPNLFCDPLDEVGRRQKYQCFRDASAVICVSQATRHQVERFYGRGNSVLRVVPNAYQKDVFQVLAPGAGSVSVIAELPYLLYIGSRIHYKNFDGLLDAYRQWEHRDSVSLVVVGAPWSKEERQLLDVSGLTSRVRLFNQVDDVTLCRLYNDALAFVYPSFEEGFGIPVLEAMACGCPVIASRIPSTIEVAAECPIYFEPDQPNTLLAALDQALLTGRTVGRVEAGLERVKHFSWEDTARLTLDVYRTVWQLAEKTNGSA